MAHPQPAPANCARPCVRRSARVSRCGALRVRAATHEVTLQHGGVSHALRVRDTESVLSVALDKGIQACADASPNPRRLAAAAAQPWRRSTGAT